MPAAILTPVQIFVGDTAARSIAGDQPVKFAAMEYVAQTSRQVPEWLGGVYVNGNDLRRDQDPVPGLAARRVRAGDAGDRLGQRRTG